MVNYPLIKDVELFLNDKPSVFALRDKAKRCLNEIGFPTKKTEQYKYTDVKQIISSNFEVLTNDEGCSGVCCCDNKKSSFFIEIVFCKGALHVEGFVLPEGVTVTPLPVALFDNEYKKYIFNSFDMSKYPFGALNGMYLEQGVCIEIEDGVNINDVIKINYKNCHANNTMMNIHNIFLLGKNASIELVEEFVSSNENEYFTNIVNEIYLKDNSNFKHYKIQKESRSSFHIALNAVKVNKEAKYEQFYLSNGAKLCRNENLINLDRESARAEVYSAYIANKDCLTDITTNVNHNVENTFSNQYAKSVLESDSKATFQGKVRIEKDAVKVEGNQLHKALYLGDDAELNCKPELEIYADDVKCSHGASCGEIDKEQLFYLTSRGIDKECAVKMLIDAHLREILSLINNETIRGIFETNLV